MRRKMEDAISIFVGGFGFFSGLAADESPITEFPSVPVISAVGVDEIGVEAFLIGPAALGEAATVTGAVVATAGTAGFWSFVVLGRSVAVVLAFMM